MNKSWFVLALMFLACGDNRADKSQFQKYAGLTQCSVRVKFKNTSYFLYLEDDTQERWGACSQPILPYLRKDGYEQPFSQQKWGPDEDPETWTCQFDMIQDAVADSTWQAQMSYSRRAQSATYSVIDNLGSVISEGEMLCKIK